MRKMIRRFMQILDGTPAADGQQPRGQSIVEMAFITPIILILIAGIVEIGWLANNYLILQEVAKVGARRGVQLAGDDSPLNWDNRGSLIPAEFLEGEQLDYTPGSVYSTAEANALRVDLRRCGGNNGGYFYTIMICEMLQSAEPLVFRLFGTEDNDIDDIVISVFAVENIHYADYTGQPFRCTAADCDYGNNGEVDFDSVTPLVDKDDFEPGTWNPVVVGRYPTNANECNAQRDSSGNLNLLNPPPERDPFDYINDGVLSLQEDIAGGAPAFPEDPLRPIELWVRDDQNRYLSLGRDTSDLGNPYGYDLMERQRGFSLSGNRRIEEIDGVLVDCYGSSFSIYDVQELMRVPQFEMTDQELDQARAARPDFGVDAQGGTVDVRQFIPSQGVIIVEIWWEHDLLLDIPVFNPVFSALGDDRTTLYVWAAFPAPSVEPSIVYFTLDE